MKNQSTLTETVVRDLKREILSGRLTQGQRMPPERELAAHYKVSRVTIRAALAHMAKLGFVETLPQSGTFVKEYWKNAASVDLLVDIISSGEPLDPEVLVDLLELRRVLEEYAVERAVARMLDKDVDTLRELVGLVHQHLDDPERLVELDFRLRIFFAELSGNPVLRVLLNLFRPVYLLYEAFFFTIPESPRTTAAYFDRLLKAVEMRDEQFASFVMGELLRYAEITVRKALEDSPDSMKIL